MCGSMADIQSATAEIRRGNKERKKERKKKNKKKKKKKKKKKNKKKKKKKKKKHDKNIMSESATQGGHNKLTIGEHRLNPYIHYRTTTPQR